MSLQFKVDADVFSFPEGTIPKGSFLDMMANSSMHVQKEDGAFMLTGISLEHFRQVHTYLVNGDVPPIEVWSTLDYFCIDMLDYDWAWQREEQMRKYMYHPEYAEHAINTNLHYNLVKLTPELWDALELQHPEDPTMIRCTNKHLQKQSWSEVHKSLEKLNTLLVTNSFVAGGRVFSALFGTHSNDVDLFLYGMNSDDAYKKIKESVTQSTIKEITAQLRSAQFTDDERALYHQLRLFDSDNSSSEINASVEQLRTLFYEKDNKYQRLYDIREKLTVPTTIMRTKNALSFNQGEHEVQFILRLYRTPSEILHGFDVDCCAMGYDGEHLWMTQRCLSALVHGYNTFSFDRLSPSYEWRLVKYSTRGMPVKVPGLSLENFDNDAMEARWSHHLNCTDLSTNSDRRYKEIKGRDLYQLHDTVSHPTNLKGVDILVYMQFHCRKYNYNCRSLETVSRLSKESSDYSPIPFSRSKNPSGQSFSYLLEYLLSEFSKDNYPQEFAKCAPYLSQFLETSDSNQNLLNLYVNNIPIAPKIYFVATFNTVDPQKDFELICNLPERLHDGLGALRPWDFPRTLEFKTTKPGEQMTGSFQQLILEDTNRWYEGHYYHS